MNRNADPVSSPIYYQLVCLGADGALLAGTGGEEAIPEIPPGETARIEGPVLGCPLFVVAANGFNA